MLAITAIERAAYLAHIKSASYQRRIDESRIIIGEGFKICSAPYVSCSFGKDSAVLLDLVRKIKPDIEVRFIRWPETEYLGNYDEVIESWLSKGANIKILDLQRDSLDNKVSNRWEMLRHLSATDGVFIGLRSEESLARRMTLKIHGALHRYKDGYYRISPLAWWRIRDIAAYIIQHDLPTLDAYKRRGFSERTSSRIPRAEVRGSMLRQIRSDDPQSWARLVQIYPEVEQWVNI